jgi:hypothetical protein
MILHKHLNPVVVIDLTMHAGGNPPPPRWFVVTPAPKILRT